MKVWGLRVHNAICEGNKQQQLCGGLTEKREARKRRNLPARRVKRRGRRRLTALDYLAVGAATALIVPIWWPEHCWRAESLDALRLDPLMASHMAST